VFHYLWLHLNPRQRTFTATTLLDILQIFFEVDEHWLQESLGGAGIANTTVMDILATMTTTQASRRRARAGSLATLSALKKAGFFAEPQNQTLFARAGLIDG
jgi:hypothetical protein